MYKFFMVLLFIFTLNLNASDINWAKDFKSGIEEAKKKNKPIFFLSSNHNCKYCIKLKKTTLKDKKVIQKLNYSFVSIVTYSDESDYMPEELWRPATPASWFLLPNGDPMFQPVMGAVETRNFLEMLENVKKEFDEVKNKK
ncbi:MAG: DUF255 domain-containing protein [Sulfurimonas sp.]|nr:DUF255 domain-containing protein [Sulfurimonas sp.]